MSSALDYPSPHKKSARAFEIQDYLLICGGPVSCSDRVRKALAFPTLTVFCDRLVQIMDEIKTMARYVFQTKNPFTLAIQTSGNGGNESILLNLLDPGEKVLVAIAGNWGELVNDMAKRYHLDVTPLRKPPGEVYTNEELEAAIVQYKPALLFVTHGESTGGTVQPLEGLGEICHKHNCLFAVDAIVSIGVEPLFVDRWGIDAVSAGSQKAIGAPPGLCLLSFSERAQKRMFEKKERPPYYYDLKLAANYWKCFDNPFAYHHTYSSNSLAALREALAELCEEGLESMWARHKANAELFWRRIGDIGLEHFVQKPENRFRGVCCVNIPKDVHWPTWLKYIADKYTTDMSPGFGPTLNKALRLGFMGGNSRPEVVEYVIEVLRDGLEYCRKNPSTINGPKND